MYFPAIHFNKTSSALAVKEVIQGDLGSRLGGGERPGLGSRADVLITCKANEQHAF